MNGQKTIMHDYHINTIPAAFVNGKTQQGGLTAEKIEQML
jgi:protein-disulfide isomerase